MTSRKKTSYFIRILAYLEENRPPDSIPEKATSFHLNIGNIG
jgi:hypothetical protein